MKENIKHHLTEVELQECIADRKHPRSAHIKECRDCFHRYVHLKEALFLMKRGEKATASEEVAVLAMVRKQNRQHVRILLRFLGDRVLLSSAGQEELDFQAVEASFSYRGDHLQGPISITRRIGEREITIVLTPAKSGDGFLVSVLLNSEEDLEVVLYREGAEMERIANLRHQKMFDSAIPQRGATDLVFRSGGAEVCTVNLTLESDA